MSYGLNLHGSTLRMEIKKLEEIVEIIAEAGRAIIDVYNSDDFNEQLKADNTSVTRADKASSAIINKGLKELFCGMPILDEENKFPDFKSRQKWNEYFLLDPLDGTREFIKRNGEFCINLALMKTDRPEEGWIYEPLKKRGWYCKKGAGIVEFSDSGDLSPVNRPGLSNEVIRVATSRSFFKPREAELIEKMKKDFQLEIIHCGSSKKQIEIIKGNADMYLKAGPCSEWDTAPGQLMVEEFGGTVFRQDNFKPMRYNKPDLINPYFVMLNERLNIPDFVKYMQKVIVE